MNNQDNTHNEVISELKIQSKQYNTEEQTHRIETTQELQSTVIKTL